ncbi:MAG TPA: sigma-54 dependent transcriptional regulator [Candidatus Coprenecus stercoravium]|uniref:Sigma-54 dependent transcriptional regulator n=1 Tax=Candidatus Coprenecus stercoravium TaxID=2840735 RepID=A0A9D2GPS9_9BACT|nr:sigma-54 dependent transcriptional regulator [Candidatus Coprenecus stercoravium]
MELDEIKNRFGIIGNDPRLNNALDTAIQIAGTNLSVLITGESGVGKEVIPKIIHAFSPRKHNNYIAINCGAIPEGTIESELFGHEKGSFTGANEARKGYFEVASGGTIFLDEVGELPLSTQVRLLRVLESGEFIRVGSSKIQKTDVRVIAASNVNFMHAIKAGKFREDLYYRLNAVPIYIPPLRERKGDIHLLFMKFALDCADKYKMPAVRLTPEARILLEEYRWPGNVRQLKNVAEQISVLENNRQITPDVLRRYLPVDDPNNLPVRNCDSGTAGNIQDRDIIFKMLFQLREEVDNLKSMMASGNFQDARVSAPADPVPPVHALPAKLSDMPGMSIVVPSEVIPAESEVPKTIHDVNDDMIRRALEKHEGRRKAAAAELGISERTLYRKIKELKINDK